MKVPKEIAKKTAEYEEAKQKADKLFAELEEWSKENGLEDLYIENFGIVQEPKGEEQGNGEYCNQYMRFEDSGDGTYYYPIEDSTQYMWVGYSFQHLKEKTDETYRR